MKASQTDLREWVAIKNRAQCFYTVHSIEHSPLKISDLQWVCHLLSEENILIPLLFFFVFSIKGEPGRNGNPGEVGFSGSPVSLYLSV